MPNTRLDTQTEVVTREEFDTTLAVLEKLHTIFVKYASEHSIENATSYSVVSFDEDDVVFQWLETWRYGGEELHIKTVPTTYFVERTPVPTEGAKK